jgi:predicted glycosyl hydrolase (DUF1957 family)
MKYVNFLFHIYQPPIQEDRVLAEVVTQSYEPLTKCIREFCELKFTLNVNFSLLQLLDQPFPHVIDNIRTAYENGSLELTATGAYHPIFPLIPLDEVARQIDINQRGTRELLSPLFKPEGIFPPELAFTGRLVPLFKSMGYKWTIADDGTFQYYGSKIPYNVIYSFNGFAIFLRSNLWANKFASYRGQWSRGKDFVDELLSSMKSWMGDGDGYLIIALDGETFGHHHPSLNEKFVREVFEALYNARNHLQTAHLSDIYQHFPQEPQFIPPSTWSTDHADIQNRDYFSWWNSRLNKIHLLQAQFTSLVLQRVRKLDDPEINEEMDKALYSCQFWWASYWKFSPREIYKGAFNLMRILQKAVDILNSQTSRFLSNKQLLEEGEKVFRELITEIEKKKHGAED